MLPLQQTLQAIADSQKPPKRPLAEAQVYRLRELYARYTRICPFNAGDLVSPRDDSPYALVDQPHIVLEVALKPFVVFAAEEATSDRNGMKLDMRVGLLSGHNHLSALWVESLWFEAWTERKPDAGAGV